MKRYIECNNASKHIDSVRYIETYNEILYVVTYTTIYGEESREYSDYTVPGDVLDFLEHATCTYINIQNGEIYRLFE